MQNIGLCLCKYKLNFFLGGGSLDKGPGITYGPRSCSWEPLFYMLDNQKFGNLVLEPGNKRIRSTINISVQAESYF